MSLDGILFALRIVAGLALLIFVLAIFVMLWRDFRVINREVETRTRQRGRLRVLRSESSTMTPGMAFPLLPMTSLGRAPTNTIIVDDSYASNQHALVILRSGQWWLEDLGSSNGTLLNGYPVEEPVVVSSGDIIGMGKLELKLELE